MQEANIQPLVAEVQAAWNTHDMQRFARCWAQDADFVNVAGMWWRGRGEIEERHAASHATRFRQSRIALELAEVREIAPGVGVAHLRWTLEGHEASGPRRTTEPRHGVWTWVLREREGRIEIAASHNTDSLSPPRAP
jgi:uncharacterized protein (TIGR02246 family)